MCLPFGDDLRILVAAFSLAVESTRVLCLAIQFFDDVELAMVLETSSHQRYVNTIEYATVKEEMAAIPLDQYKEDWTMADIAHSLAQQNIQVCL